MKKITAALLTCALLLSGCTQSNLVQQEGNREPDTEIQEGIEISWSQVWDELDNQFIDPELYPFSESVNCNVVEEEKRIEFILLVQPGTTREEAASYATTVIKGFNDCIATQDFSYEYSTEDTYGSYVSGYDVTMLVAPYDSKEDSSTWILEDTIKANSEYRDVGAETE